MSEFKCSVLNTLMSAGVVPFPAPARCRRVRRLEIAHFWQQVCLSISVHESDTEPSEREDWIDAGDTRVRLRGVEAVAPIGGEWGPAAWGPPVLVLLTIVGALICERPAAQSIDELVREMEADALANPLSRRSQMAAIFGSGVWTDVHELPASSPPVPCVRGDVLVIVNETPWPVRVSCTDPSVNTPSVLQPFASLRAVPETLPTCRFARGDREWSYAVPPPPSKETRALQRRTWDGACGPTLYFLHMDTLSTLVGVDEALPARFAEPLRPNSDMSEFK